MTNDSTASDLETVDTRPIRYRLGGWTTVSGAQDVSVILCVRDEELVVYTWNSVGAGTPADVWHGIDRTIAVVPTDTVVESLEAELRAREDEIPEIASHFRGTHWNGHNLVGSWGDEGDTEMGPRALMELDVQRSWEVGDWLDPAAHEVCEQVRETLAADPSATLATVAATLEDEAAREGVHLAGDTVEALVALVENALERLDEDDEDDSESIAVYRRALASR